MKKNKISLGLVSSLVGVLALSACSSVVPSKENIVSFVGYDGNEIGIVTDKAYEEFLKTPNGISKFYDAVMETLIRYQFQTEGSALYGKTDKDYDEIVIDAKRRVKSAKDEAKKAAKDNDSTTYDEEWEAKLEAEGVEDEKELLEKYIYAEEKDQAEDWYFEENRAQLTSEYIGVTKTGTDSSADDVAALFPYHIRHILVSIETGGTNFTRGTITEGESLNLATVIETLRDGILDFGEVAKRFSSDTGSAAKYGSVGIMTTETSFVNEFKLGIYAYDAALSGKTNKVIEEGLGLNNNYKDYKTNTTTSVKTKFANGIGLQRVPYQVFEKIDEYKAITTSDAGFQVNNGNESYYPRNIYFNKYVNFHNPFVISNHLVSGNQNALGAIDASITAATGKKCGFRAVNNVTGTRELILTDENGNPIIGVRSEHGIHLMIMEKSIFDFADSSISLNDYYTTYTPNDKDYPNVGDEQTYVTYINTKDQSVLNERAEEVESAIKSFDKTYNYRLYEYFVEEGDLKFADNTAGIYAQEQIEKYIETSRLENLHNQAENLESSWRTYLELLDQQAYERGRENNLIQEGCAIGFKNAHKSNGERQGDFVEGGACYYAN